jgi:hypothetical protein
VGIGICKTNAGISIPASVISVWYHIKKMPDCIVLFRYQIGSGIVSLSQSGNQADMQLIYKIMSGAGQLDKSVSLVQASGSSRGQEAPARRPTKRAAKSWPARNPTELFLCAHGRALECCSCRD